MCPLGNHVNTNASSKNSDTFSFSHLNKNYFPRKYDTSNKVLPILQKKQSNDNICIKPVSNSVTSIQDGISVEVTCLYCSKVYKSGAGLKHHMNRWKERDKEFDKRESSVISCPRTENDNVDMTIGNS